MANYPFEAALALESLRAPLNPHPMSTHEKYIHEIRVRFRTYYVEFNVLDGAVRLPRMFADDFGDEIGRLATLIDLGGNQFEVLVDKVNDSIYLTKGWAALRDFYNIRIGCWMELVYTGMDHFGIFVMDRFHNQIDPPLFVPPMKLVIDKIDVPPYFVDNIPDSPDLLAYSHDPSYFHILHDKVLNHFDVSSGFLVLPYEGFGEHVFHQTTRSVKLVDDSENAWFCSLTSVSTPVRCFKLGGQWSKIVAARRLSVGDNIRLGVQAAGAGEIVYLERDP